MMYIMTSITTSVMLSTILMIVCFKVSSKSIADREKSSPFECGFDPMSSARMPFSIQFFLIAVLFLIFDVEIAIILPMIITIKTSVVSSWITTVTMFIIILILGLYHEWNNGMLEWAT